MLNIQYVITSLFDVSLPGDVLTNILDKKGDTVKDCPNMCYFIYCKAILAIIVPWRGGNIFDPEP
jgi:hypothetical protein